GLGGQLGLLVHVRGLHSRVLALSHRHRLKVPAEDGAVEVLRSINVVGRNFEVHDLAHDEFLLEEMDVRRTTLRTLLPSATAGAASVSTLVGHDSYPPRRATGRTGVRVRCAVSRAVWRGHPRREGTRPARRRPEC